MFMACHGSICQRKMVPEHLSWSFINKHTQSFCHNPRYSTHLVSVSPMSIHTQDPLTSSALAILLALKAPRGLVMFIGGRAHVPFGW